MNKLLECVPNFSEGRDRHVLETIAASVRENEGVYLLNIDPGEAANRTVITFAGEPDAVITAARNAIKTAAEQIDMNKQHGKHPRMGATDVCPLIPLRGMDIQEASELACKLGSTVGNDLNIPVYLYEASANASYRSNLADIRKGGFEGLAKKMAAKEWEPDFGPASPHPTAGATAIGARDFLVAFNINLNTKDLNIARRIAGKVRESGTLQKRNGKQVRIPGRLTSVKALGWYIEEYDCTQVSMNLTNYRQTNMAETFEAVREEALLEGVDIRGSELVGMIPADAVRRSVGWYSKSNISKSEDEQVKILIEKLELGAVKPFKPEERIIEWQLRKQGVKV